MPRTSRRFMERAVLGLGLLLSLLLSLTLGMPRDAGVFDEGNMLTGVMCVLQGAVPHRDFYTSYGPGQYYALAALFKIFGANFLVARFYDLLIRAAVLAVLFYLIRKQCSLLCAVLFTAIGWLP